MEDTGRNLDNNEVGLLAKVVLGKGIDESEQQGRCEDDVSE